MRKHKKKAIAAGIVAALIAVLEAYPLICPLLPFKIDCTETAKLAEFGRTKLEEAQDAGTFE